LLGAEVGVDQHGQRLQLDLGGGSLPEPGGDEPLEVEADCRDDGGRGRSLVAAGASAHRA